MGHGQAFCIANEHSYDVWGRNWFEIPARELGCIDSLTLVLANNPVFVDRGLKYIDEVTLVSEAAKSFPGFLVPYV